MWNQEGKMPKKGSVRAKPAVIAPATGAKGKKASALASQSLIGARVRVQCRCVGRNANFASSLWRAASYIYVEVRATTLINVVSHTDPLLYTHTYPSAMVLFTRARFRLGRPKLPSIPSCWMMVRPDSVHLLCLLSPLFLTRSPPPYAPNR